MNWLTPLEGSYMRLEVTNRSSGRPVPNRPVMVDGVRYENCREAAKACGVKTDAIYKRARKGNGVVFL